MPRYFLELSYKGTNYSGFQIQFNSVTVQGEVEKAMAVYFRKEINLTGSSRTDAGVHAIRNYFHFDHDQPIPEQFLYNINSILPADITIKKVINVGQDAHCRFDAVSREYTYYIYSQKNPFLNDRAWFYPYPLETDILEAAARVVCEYSDFTSFSKRKTQVKTFKCSILESEWKTNKDGLVYHIRANRFLRGMVRGLVGTMLLAGRKKISLSEFRAVIESKNSFLADFTTPAHGLFLEGVEFPEGYFRTK
jgi:tRNA pseudouridine38-40 synthase